VTAEEKFKDSQVPQILPLVFKFGDYLHQLWNYYMVVNGLIVGWMLSTKEPWALGQKFVVAALYLAFIIINVSAMHRMYYWLNMSIEDLKSNAGRLDENTPKIKAAIKGAKIPGGKILPVVIYGLAASAVFVSIFCLK
jgi:hypothetical protein